MRMAVTLVRMHVSVRHVVLVVVSFGKVMIHTDDVFMLVLVFERSVTVAMNVNHCFGHDLRIVR